MASPAKRAGLVGITWHSLRHFHASTLSSDGVNPAYVAQWLGHDISMLSQYLFSRFAPRR
jgi:integrase